MKKKMSIVLMLFLFTMVFTNIASAEEIVPVLRGLIYEVDGQYVEVTPLQYFTLEESSNDDFRSIIYCKDGSPKVPQALVDTRGYVFSLSMYFATDDFSKLNENQQVTEDYLLNHGSIEINQTGVVIIHGSSEPTATVTITPHSLLNEGFSLVNVEVNVTGVEGAAKYSITYSVYDNDNNEKKVTTKLANIRQANEDLIQFIDEETSKIKVNLYDANNNQINTEFETELIIK